MIFTDSDLGGMMQPFQIIGVVDRSLRSEFRIAGILDTPSQDYVINDEGFATSQNNTVFTVKTDAIAKVKPGQMLFLNGKNYRISDINNDESLHGYSKLVLKV